MALLRAGEFGLDMTQSTIGAYQFLTVRSRTSTELVADFRLFGLAGYVVRFSGQGLDGNPATGAVSGSVNLLSETFYGSPIFELTGASIPAQTVLNWIRTSGDSAAFARIFSGDDTIQGGSGNDTLLGFTGRNVISGGGGADTAVIAASRSATQSFRFRDEAVVVRAGAGQVDQLSSIEIIRYADGEVAQSALAAAQPFQYLASYADLAQAYGADELAGWRHFAGAGLAEDRAVTFSGLNYLASYRDLANAYGTDAEAGARHFLTSGRAEGRAETFDGLRYIASYGDLIPVLPRTVEAGAMHFINSGAAEGRSVTFDPLRYLASNLDVARAYGTDEARALDHWLTKGFSENRQTASFNAAEYISQYDLRTAFGTDQRAATLHWIQTGAAEGRSQYEPRVILESIFTVESSYRPPQFEPTPLPL